MTRSILFILILITPATQLMSQATNNENSISLLDNFANAFNAHDVSTILSLMTDDCVFEASAGPDADGEKFTGKPAVKKAFEDVFSAFPDAHWGNVRHFISGDRGFRNGFLRVQNRMGAG